MASDWRKSSGTSRVYSDSADKAAVTRWINQTLSAGGYADIVTDIADMGDGITLLKLVQTLSKEDLPRHSPAPMMRAERLENLQICLTYLQQQHQVELRGVLAEDLLARKVSSILTVCNTVKKHFSSSARTSKGQRSFKYSSMEKEDMRVLMWLGELVGREITNYSTLYDGYILCELMNIVHEGAINDTDLKSSISSVERLKLVESAARKSLYMTSLFDAAQVSDGGGDTDLRTFLQQCKQIYQQRQHRRGATERLSGAGKKEAKAQAAHVSARSYDGIHKKDQSRPQPASTGLTKKQYPDLAKKQYPDLYVQGASSFTDLRSRRTEHEHMIRGVGGSGRPGNISRHSSTSSESLDHDLFTPFGGLDRVHSMESGISQQQGSSWSMEQLSTLARSASQGNLPPPLPSTRPPLGKSLARSTESFQTQTFSTGPGRRTPSYLQLSSAASEDLAEQLRSLEERIGVLASHFLYERRDMFKQILHALVKERRKRQLAERRIEALEKSSRQLVQHYDKTLIDLAKQVAVLRSEVAVQRGNSSSTLVTTEIEQLKDQLSALTEDRQKEPKKQLLNHLPDSRPAAPQLSNTTLFLRKRAESEASANETSPANVLTAYSKGSAASFKKLSHFFGEAPPRVEDLQSLCEELGYSALLPKLRAHKVGLVELRTLTEEHLEAIGIPLGARVRLLDEVKKLEPVDSSKLRHLRTNDFGSDL